MNEENRELYLDLLIKKASTGLDEAEEIQLDHMGGTTADVELRSFETAAAAVSLAAQTAHEPLPEHLYAKISASAEKYLSQQKQNTAKEESPWPPVTRPPVFTASDIFSDPPKRSWFGWIGWAAAALACIALVLNLWFTRSQPAAPDRAQVRPTETPAKVLTPAEARDAMLASNTPMVKATWTAGNVKEMNQITGDVVWSDQKQAGYMRFRGLPPNDPAKATYQLWIFDKTQDKATPIDGGTFDVNSDGEVVIPINAKLKAEKPEMFAITMEKPGGVVVSKNREKLAAIAKVETQAG